MPDAAVITGLPDGKADVTAIDPSNSASATITGRLGMHQRFYLIGPAVKGAPNTNSLSGLQKATLSTTNPDTSTANTYHYERDYALGVGVTALTAYSYVGMPFVGTGT